MGSETVRTCKVELHNTKISIFVRYCTVWWIGVQMSAGTGETNPSEYLSYKNRGVSGTSKGQIVWVIEPEAYFDRAVTKACFKYYHGPTASLLAMTPTVTIRNPFAQEQEQNSDEEDPHQSPLLMLSIGGMKAESLKKGMFFNPDPYVKMSVHPGKKRKFRRFQSRHMVGEQHQRTSVRGNTCMPVWNSEQEFQFTVTPTDVLELEVKDKFAKSRPIISRFLGRVSVPIQRLLEKVALGEHTVSYPLGKRHPTDHINGVLTFTMNFEELPHTNGAIVNGDATDVERNRSQSVPVVSLTSEDGEPEGPRPRSPTSEAVDILHVIATRTVSAPPQATTTTELSVDVSPSRIPQVSEEPTTPTDPILTNPISQEQLNLVTQEAQDRGQTLADVENILCQDVLDVNDTQVNGSPSQTTSPPIPTSLHLDLPNSESNGGPMVNGQEEEDEEEGEEEGGQENEERSNEVPLLQVSEVDTDESPNTRRRRTGQFAMDVTNEMVDSDSDGSPQRTAQQFVEVVAVKGELSTEEDQVGLHPTNSHSLHRDSGSSTHSQRESISSTDSSESRRSLEEVRRLQQEITQEVTRMRTRAGPTAGEAVGNSVTGSNNSDSQAEGSEDSAGGNSTHPSGAAEGSQNGEVSEHSTGGSTPGEGSSGAVGGQPSLQKKSSAVWKKRQARSANPNLRITLPENTQETAHTDSTPTTPVMTPNRATYMRYELPDSESPLPSNWEARIDQYGRIFYIDHMTHVTTWRKPKKNQQSGEAHQDSRDPEQSRRQLHRRYQSFNRTLSREENRPQERVQQPAAAGPSTEIHVDPPSREEVMLEAPAVKLIARPDFFTVLHSYEAAKTFYQRTTSVKHMVNRVRRDPNKFKDYQHNRDLVALINLFADTAAELPRGWESKKDKGGKEFFINHNTRTTTFIDPRIPYEVTDPATLLQIPNSRMRSHSEGEEIAHSSSQVSGSSSQSGPPVQPRPAETLSDSAHADEVPMAYNEKVVAFLKQPNILNILAERQPTLEANQPLKEKITTIRQEGVECLERLSNDFELNLLLSLFDDSIASFAPTQPPVIRSSLANISPHESPNHSPRNSPVVSRANRAPAPYRRSFESKLRNLYRKLEYKGYGQGPTKLKLTIRRDHLLEDAFGKITAITKKDIQKCKLFICFAGEEGLDYGGPSREFFFLLSRELFNPYYGLFEYSAIDTYTVQISPMSAFVDSYLDWFRFCGRVIGLAIIHHFLLDAFFTRPFYKALLRQMCTLVDLESLDAEFHQSLSWMRDNDITGVLDLLFTADEEVFGQIMERELKPNGKNIPVTEKNKKEYIQKMVKFRIERGVSEQSEALVKGVYEVIDPRMLSVFDARELELVIAGTAEIDISDWRKNTEYRGGYHNSHHVILWFWNAVERFDNERRLRLLQFVTGTSSIPYEGFAALRGSNGPKKFCIEKWGSTKSLPRAHTCFNRLDLPPYPNFAMLLEKLVIAVEETSTFSMD
ncbi:E3 ubiquitin-protein ligase HECW2-like isoform X3 [Apostichopus japonicus]|uniref:E3 ubiquitin-protein ligase HECW2-like isoform X3 n=1 Tax=Stichopus japonicus TaxID=307972 RepID=UPI003AB562E2